LITPESVGKSEAGSSAQPQNRAASRGNMKIDVSLVNQGNQPQPFMTPNVKGDTGSFIVSQDGDFDIGLKDHACEL